MVLPWNSIDLVFRRKEVSRLVVTRQRSAFDVGIRAFVAVVLTKSVAFDYLLWAKALKRRDSPLLNQVEAAILP